MLFLDIALNVVCNRALCEYNGLQSFKDLSKLSDCLLKEKIVSELLEKICIMTVYGLQWLPSNEVYCDPQTLKL